MASTTGLRMGASHKQVIHAEILAVTSMMRRNSRWASSLVVVGHRQPRELGSNLGLRISTPVVAARTSDRNNRGADLMDNFVELKRIVQEIPDIRELDLPILLGPFFALIRSPLSTGPITSAALSALHTFFVCEVISPDSLQLEIAMTDLSNTIAHCKFEASDSSSDEVVLLKIVTVIQDCLTSPVAEVLGDTAVCAMLETVLTTCCEMRLSGTIRRYAENSMHIIVRRVVRKLGTLDPEEEEAKLKLEEETDAEVKFNVQSPREAPPAGEPQLEVPSEARAASLSRPVQDAPQIENSAEEVQPVTPIDPEHTVVEDEEPPVSPIKRPEYGLPSILEVLRVMVNVLDPNNQRHTDSMRIIALGILNAVFEEVGHYIPQFPSLRALILDSGCKYLFQLARSDNIAVLQLALRTISAIFDCMRKDLKLQHELFLTFTVDRLSLPPAKILPSNKRGALNSPRPGTPSIATPPLGPSDEKPDSKPRPPPARGEIRDFVLEILSYIVQRPNFMVELYANYDCDTNCENLFEKLIEFMTKGVYPAQGLTNPESQRNTQYICLEMLLSFVNDMAMHANIPPELATPEPESVQSLLDVKSRKEILIAGADRFNAKPKTALPFLEENGLIYHDLSPEVSKTQSLAKFLKSCGRIDKKVLGDYISTPENEPLLQAFLRLFDFHGKGIAEAMREMLEAFRLPGEASPIARIAENFSRIFFASGPEEIKTADACYILTYSIIMLNTDQHNPQVRKRMTVEDYTKNLRGVNDGDNFPLEYLTNIYESVKKNAFIIPEEHLGQVGFDHAWKELLTRSKQAGDFIECKTPAFDIEMFKAVWKPVISANAYAFVTFDDDYIIQKATTGFRQCATLAGRYRAQEVLDFVVVSLSQATGLLSDSLPAEVPNYPVIEDEEGQSVTVSKLSVEFGTNIKGQLAAVVLFNIVNGNGSALREGWTQIFEMFQNLFLHSLLPLRMLQMEDFLGGVSMIPLRGSQPPHSQAQSQGGLLSALSSYLMTPYSHESQVPDATEEDLEHTLCTIDCIKSCRLDELYSQIMQLDSEAMVAAVRALEALAHERTVAKLKLRSEDLTSLDDPPYVLPYDPAAVFLLETMASITCQAPQYIEELWPVLFEHLSALLSSAAQYSILLIERAVVCLLRLCQILAYKASLRDQIYVSFDLLSRMPRNISTSIGEQVVSGLILMMQKHPNIIRSQTEWNLVFVLLRSTMSNTEASRLTYELVCNLTGGDDVGVTPDNVTGLVQIFDEFATAASALVESHNQSRRRAEPLTIANSVPLERGKKSVDLIAALFKKLPEVVEGGQITSPHTWKQVTLPILISLGRQSVNASREVRHAAISQLQRILLGQSLSPDNTQQSQVEDIFNRVVFPLIDDLLKPQVFQRDVHGMAETRLRASALLCKSFMHLEVREDKMRTDFRLLWIQILDLLDRLMSVGKGDQLYEAVPESLKNVLLVMNAVGILVPPSPEAEPQPQDDIRRTLWNTTHERLERFLPGFLVSVIANPSS